MTSRKVQSYICVLHPQINCTSTVQIYSDPLHMGKHVCFLLCNNELRPDKLKIIDFILFT